MMSTIQRDEDLVAQAAAGDASAFELLVRRHQAAVARLGFAMLRDRHAVEDATQETFLRAHRSLGGFRGDASFKTWLLAIANRVCVDVLRRPSHDVVSLDSVRDDRAHAADEAARPALELAVRALPEGEREAFMLVDALGFSREEAAATLEIPVTTLKSRLTRAHERLIEALREFEPRARTKRSKS